MRLGAIIPNEGPLPRELGIGAMARAAEDAGADSVWVSDHLLMVDSDGRDYPYSADGRPTWSMDTEYYEAFVCCALMAAATRWCRIGTAVLILPQRNVLEVAKMAASLDRLSGGRLDLGVGAGWNRAEMEALGYPSKGRGERMTEMLQVLRGCWQGRPQPFAGRHVAVPADVVLSPQPEQRPGVPLLVGGMGKAALDRAARHGDGWLAIAFAERWDAVALECSLRSVLDRRTAAGAFRTVLKLHGRPPAAGALAGLAAEAWAMGFDEVIVEAPFSEGMDAAAEIVAAACEARAQTEAARR